MSSFVSLEVKKIIEDKKFEYPLNLAFAASWIAADFKCENLKLFDMRGISSLADYYLLVTTQNSVQAQAVADQISLELKKNRSQYISKEGLESADWILLDFGDIMVHLLLEPSRDLYDLDSLWASCPQVKIPSEYYVSSIPAIEQRGMGNFKSYF